MKYRFFLFLTSIILIFGCARRGRPEGGPKDFDKPIMVKADPAFESLKFKSDEIRIFFDEYIKLKDRSKIIVLDDTNILKCKRIRLELMNDNNFIMIGDNQDDRNGYSVFEKR